MRGRKRGGEGGVERQQEEERQITGGREGEERRDTMFVKERYGEMEVPRDEEGGREGLGEKGEGEEEDPDHVPWSAY